MPDEVLEAEIESQTGLFEADAVKTRDPAVYEVGYHLVSTLSEAEVATAAKDLMNFLTKEGAEFVGEKEPQKIDLAYTIQKRIGGRLTNFSSAYFGWVAFEVQPASLEMLKKFMDTNPAVLRYLLVSTTKDEVRAVMEGTVIMPTAVASTDAIAAPKRVSEEGAAVSDEALTQALDTMAAEDEGKPA